MEPGVRNVLVAVLVAVVPSIAAAQGRVVVEEGLRGPQLEPDQSILIVKGDETITMAVQPRFTVAGPDTRFAVLLATPAPPLYGTDSPTLFDGLAAATAPRVEETVMEVEDPRLGDECRVETGCGGSPGPSGADWPTPDVPDGGIDDAPPAVIAVGPYEVLRLTAADTAELTAWLDQFGYLYTQEDLDAIAPYLARGDTITAVRVMVADPGTTALDVLTLTWNAREVRLPLALGRPPFGQATRLAIYVSALGRHDVALNTPVFAAFRFGGLREFLTRTDLTITSTITIDDDPLVGPPAAGDLEIIPIDYVTVIQRVPRSNCALIEDDIGCCASGRRRVRWDAIVVALALLVTLRRRRDRAP